MSLWTAVGCAKAWMCVIMYRTRMQGVSDDVKQNESVRKTGKCCSDASVKWFQEDRHDSAHSMHNSHILRALFAANKSISITSHSSGQKNVVLFA